VEAEIADNREQLRLQWLQKIRDSWDVQRTKYFYPEDYGWLQYRNSSTVEVMKEQFETKSWEIIERSDIL
jgi:hypothetical protein